MANFGGEGAAPAPGEPDMKQPWSAGQRSCSSEHGLLETLGHFLLDFLPSRFQWHENTPLAKDLLHPSPEEEQRKHKKKHLVQSPDSYFMDVKCPGCYKITTVFSHAQTVVACVGCSTVLCQPTGGKTRLTEGRSFRRKQR
eukprot:XP_017451683.1 PREDICTED: 40S ribosomal protein S27-like [Rattus norvegicus]